MMTDEMRLAAEAFLVTEADGLAEYVASLDGNNIYLAVDVQHLRIRANHMAHLWGSHWGLDEHDYAAAVMHARSYVMSHRQDLQDWVNYREGGVAP